MMLRTNKSLAWRSFLLAGIALLVLAQAVYYLIYFFNTPPPSPKKAVPHEAVNYEKPAHSKFIHLHADKNNHDLPTADLKVTPQDLGSYHSTTLTHILLSIHSEREKMELTHLFRVVWAGEGERSSSSSFCCADWDQVFHGQCEHLLPRLARPHLVIRSALPLGFDLEEFPQVTKCFQSATATLAPSSAALEEEEEMLLRGRTCSLPGKEVGYVLFQRPGAALRRANWLTALARGVAFPVPRYWVILPFPAQFPRVPTASLSIIYRLSSHETANSPLTCVTATTISANVSETFPQYYVQHVLPHARFASVWDSTQKKLFTFAQQTYKLDQVFDSIRFELAHRVLVTDLLDHGNTRSTTDAHRNWLSHVVFALPDTPKQVERLRETLSVWWKRFPPCQNAVLEGNMLAQLEQNSCVAPSQLRRPTLVLMLSRVHASRELTTHRHLLRQAEKELEERIERDIVQGALTPLSRSCFERVEICIVSLPKHLDTYVTGSRMLFERMFQGKCAQGGSHALYIEPDARPIRAGWLTTMSTSLIFPNPPTWALGAIYQGTRHFNFQVLPTYWFFHFNGNGIYQLPTNAAVMSEEVTGMRDFADFYFERVRPYTLRTKDWETSMDMDVMDYVLAAYRKHGDARTTGRFVTHSRFTPFISNRYRSVWNPSMLPMEVQMVHGGTMEA